MKIFLDCSKFLPHLPEFKASAEYRKSILSADFNYLITNRDASKHEDDICKQATAYFNCIRKLSGDEHQITVYAPVGAQDLRIFKDLFIRNYSVKVVWVNIHLLDPKIIKASDVFVTDDLDILKSLVGESAPKLYLVRDEDTLLEELPPVITKASTENLYEKINNN